MTKQEALQELMDLSIDYGTRTAEEIERLDEAVDMAIAALRADTVDRPTCEDAVSRADVLETYADLYDVFEDSKAICKELHKVYDRINALPAVQPLVIHCTDCEDWLERQSILGVTISELPSAQPERLTNDDLETIRIHLNAYKEKLCNQQRWKEANEYQNLIDRFMAFASAQPQPVVRCKDCINNRNCDIQYHAQAGDEFWCAAAERRTDEQTDRH